METNWKDTPLYQERQSELDAAIAECERLNVNPRIGGFLARHAYQGRIPQRERGALHMTDEQQAALERYNSAQDAMKTAREEAILNMMREHSARQMIAWGWTKAQVYAQVQRNGVLLHAARQFVGVWNGIEGAPFQLSVAEVDALGLEG